MSQFAELIAATNFSFLRGASHPEEMVAAAAALGLSAIGICDRNGFPGVVRAHLAAKEAGIKLLVGTRLVTRDGFEIAAYPKTRAAYGRLSRMLTDANFRAKKGQCDLGLEDIAAASEGQVFILIPPARVDDDWRCCACSMERTASACLSCHSWQIVWGFRRSQPPTRSIIRQIDGPCRTSSPVSASM